MRQSAARAGFDRRISRINQSETFEAPVQQIAFPLRDRLRRKWLLLIRPFFMACLIVTLLKVAALHYIGPQIYMDRLELSAQGGLGQKAGAVLLWPGPLTRWIYSRLPIP